MTTLNARANQAYRELRTAEDLMDGTAAFDSIPEAFEEGWESGYKTAAREATPYLMPTREALVRLMNAHPIEAFNGSQVVCGCNLTWQTSAEYRAHHADAVLALLNEPPR